MAWSFAIPKFTDCSLGGALLVSGYCLFDDFLILEMLCLAISFCRAGTPGAIDEAIALLQGVRID